MKQPRKISVFARESYLESWSLPDIVVALHINRQRRLRKGFFLGMQHMSEQKIILPFDNIPA